VRHASWNAPEVFDLLGAHNAGFCNIDQPVIGRSLKATEETTSPVGYVRLHGGVMTLGSATMKMFRRMSGTTICTRRKS